MSRTNYATELHTLKKTNCYFIYLDMTFLDLSILDVLPEVVADGSECGMHLYAEIASESNGSFVLRTFLFILEKKNWKINKCSLVD